MNGPDTINLDELQFGESLGKGATSAVYKGRWQGKDVAIKNVTRNFTGEEVSHQKIEIKVSSNFFFS